MISPMLANQLDYDKIQTKCRGYVMEPKLDGVRCLAVRDKDGVRMYTRTGHELHEKVPHIAEQIGHYPPGIVLDGEIGYPATGSGYVPIIDFNKTMRVIGSGVEVALQKQAHEEFSHERMDFYVFDILMRDGVWQDKVIDHDRRYILKDLILSNRVRPNIQLVDRYEVWDEEKYTDYVQRGGEGVILKNPTAQYQFGKRPANSWYKIKKFETLDVKVTGFTDGQGKYKGQIGAIIFDVLDDDGDLICVSKCSGMDDLTRSLISRNPQGFVGRTMEIRYFGKVGADGSGLRFPQFLRWRGDKDI
jgi:DNA ligase 1